MAAVTLKVTTVITAATLVTRNANYKGRLITVDLSIKVARFVKK